MSHGRVLQSIRTSLAEANARARLACTENHARSSSTPAERFFQMIEQELGTKDLQVLEDVDSLLKATREKRRLTVDWRDSMMNEAELIQATAKRVGFHPPELPSSLRDEKTDS